MYRDFYHALMLNHESRRVSLKWPNLFDWFLKLFCIALFITVSLLACKELFRIEEKYLYVVGIVFGVLGMGWLYVTNRQHVNAGFYAATSSVGAPAWAIFWKCLLVMVITAGTGLFTWGVIEKWSISNELKIVCITGYVFLGVLLVVLMKARV